MPSPSSDPSHAIQHIIVLLQENRSFDSLFAGFPGTDSATVGRCNPRTPYCPKSGLVRLQATTLEASARGPSGFGDDISHDHKSFELECDPTPAKICRMDGFNRISFGEDIYGPPAKLVPYRYVERSEIAAYWHFARSYAIADHMFLTDTAASFVAHQLILSGTVRLNARESLTDQPSTIPWGCDAPKGTTTAVLRTNGKVFPFSGPFPCFTQYGTIADLLDAAKVSWKYYVDGAPSRRGGDFSGAAWNGFDAIRKIRYGSDWKTNISSPNSNVLEDVRRGTLPHVAWVIPSLAASDHPSSGCNHGPRWVTRIVDAVGSSRYWNSTAILVLWDDWGGWYDNVAPPQTDYTSLGFRVPMIAISPYVKPHLVSHTQYTYGSILKFVEETFELGSLGTTDATASSIEDVFDFKRSPSKFRTEPLPRTKPCGAQPPVEAITRHDRGVPE